MGSEERDDCGNCNNLEASRRSLSYYRTPNDHPCTGCIQTILKNWQPRRDFAEFFRRLDLEQQLDRIDRELHRISTDPKILKDLERRAREMSRLSHRDLHEPFTI